MNKNARFGFTLVEMVVTVAIMALLLALGVPSFQALMRNNRVAAHANEFLGALNLARGEAIKRGSGVRVVLCPGTSAGCSGTAWGSGWIVFVDTNNNGSRDAGEPVLRVYSALSGNETLTGNTNVSSYISFTADGSARLIGGGFQAGTLTFGLCNSSNRRNTIVINSVGRARVAPVACS